MIVGGASISSSVFEAGRRSASVASFEVLEDLLVRAGGTKIGSENTLPAISRTLVAAVRL